MTDAPSLQSTIAVNDNVLPQVLDSIAQGALKVADRAGQLFKQVAVQQCPVSKRNDEGYIHLYQTIDYEVSEDQNIGEVSLTMMVYKSYGILVNNGTSRMAPRPFFTNGVLAVQDGIDAIIEDEYSDHMAGRIDVEHMRGQQP